MGFLDYVFPADLLVKFPYWGKNTVATIYWDKINYLLFVNGGL